MNNSAMYLDFKSVFIGKVCKCCFNLLYRRMEKACQAVWRVYKMATRFQNECLAGRSPLSKEEASKMLSICTDMFILLGCSRKSFEWVHKEVASAEKSPLDRNAPCLLHSQEDISSVIGHD